MSWPSLRTVAMLIVVVLVGGSAGCSSNGTDRETDGTDAETTSAASRPDAQPSAGCTSPHTEFVAQGVEGRFVSSDVERVFSIYSPADVDADMPLPLVVNMHGAQGTAAVQEETSGLGALGEQEGFVVVAPQALGAVPIWNLSNDGPDLAFVEELIGATEAAMCIDLSRVYLTGFSMGGMMSMLLACRHPERYAAIAPVSGEIEVPDCPDPRPALLAFHGTADPAVHFDGSLEQNLTILIPFATDVPRAEIVRRWAAANGCGMPATDADIIPDVEHQTYTCPVDDAVEMYVVDGGVHAWPGSTPTPYARSVGAIPTQTIDASQLIWTFFEQQQSVHP